MTATAQQSRTPVTPAPGTDPSEWRGKGEVQLEGDSEVPTPFLVPRAVPRGGVPWSSLSQFITFGVLLASLEE